MCKFNHSDVNLEKKITKRKKFISQSNVKTCHPNANTSMSIDI